MKGVPAKWEGQRIAFGAAEDFGRPPLKAGLSVVCRSGAGLVIVRRWAEILSYEPGPPLNRLVLTLPFSPG